MVSRDTRSSTEYYINKNVEKKAKKQKPLSVGAQTLQEKKEIERAKAFVKSKGLTWGGQGDYGTKGLYTYSAGKYRGKAYFGIGGNVSQQSAPVVKPKERIPGWLDDIATSRPRLKLIPG